jgi:hypothetical protein
MVLAAPGSERAEKNIAHILRSYEFGTPASRVTHLAEWGYEVQFGRSSIEDLGPHIDRGLLPIVFVRADLLPWAEYGGFRALVLVEIRATDVALHDPALETGPTRLSKDSFLVAWEEFDCLAANISRP